MREDSERIALLSARGQQRNQLYDHEFNYCLMIE